MTVHHVAAPDVNEPARTASGRWKMLLVLAVCASPVLASYFTYFVIRPDGRNNYGQLITPARQMPADLPLTTLSGQALQAKQLKDQWLIVVVAGSACDSRCERYLLLQRQLRETLGREKDRVDKVWLITDGGPLKPELMQAIHAAPEVTALRVPRDALAAWLQPAAASTLDAHLYVVDPMGGWMLRTPDNPDGPKLKKDIERLLRASASWDQAGR